MHAQSSGMEVRWPNRLSEIPKEVFHRADVYKAELERIFRGDEWHPLAHMAEIPNRGTSRPRISAKRR